MRTGVSEIRDDNGWKKYRERDELEAHIKEIKMSERICKNKWNKCRR